MPNADWRYKLLLISVLFSAGKIFDFASVPRMGFSCSVLGHIALQCRSYKHFNFVAAVYLLRRSLCAGG
jgi:hypothetical protein